MRPRAPHLPAPEARPDDLIAVGKVLAAFGVRGQLKIVPFSPAEESVLRGQKQLWMGLVSGQQVLYQVDTIRRSGEHFIATLQGIDDRDAALALGKPDVWISRKQFPASRSDEFYWVDLIGCAVVNRQAETLGVVSAVDDHGAHALLHVQAASGASFLIPFVAMYIDRVAMSDRVIYVDWQADYA